MFVRVIVPRRPAPPICSKPTVWAAGTAGEPATATVVTSSEEDRYIHDVQASAQKMLARIDKHLLCGWSTYVSEKASNDPFWTVAHEHQRDVATDYELWTLDLDLHVQEWDKRTILDSAGRFLAGGVAGGVAGGTAAVFLVNDWASKTAEFDRQLHEWANKLVDAGVLAPSDVPDDKINRPQSILTRPTFTGDFGVGAVATSIVKPVLIVGGLALAVVIAIQVIPPMLAARAAAKASAA